MADHGAAGIIFQGWVTALRDDPAAGLKTLEEGLARQREIATNEDLSVYLCLLAECLIKVGRADEAVARIMQELPDLEASDLWIWMPELYRVLGEAILAAELRCSRCGAQRFVQAAALTAEQQVPMLGLRVALSQARLGPGSGTQVSSRLCTPRWSRSRNVNRRATLARQNPSSRRQARFTRFTRARSMARP